PSESISDPREPKAGPLPKDFAHYRGLYQNGDQVVLSYTVGKAAVLEMPGLESSAGGNLVSRTLNIASAKEALTVSLCSFDADTDQPNPGAKLNDARLIVVGKTQPLAVGVIGAPENVHFAKGADDLQLVIPAHSAPLRLKILFQAAPDSAART